MKKTKRIISLVLTGALSLTGLNAINTVSAAGETQTATETKATGVVFSEGFEEWDVGVLADTAGTYTVGNLKFDLNENDKLEIAVNNYGNKALKITKGSTDSNTIRYVFPEQYSGMVDVTFDFLSEHNSRYFSEFANLEYSAAGNTMIKYTQYQNDLYAAQGTVSGTILRGTFSPTRHNGYVKFTTKYNTVDNPSKTFTFGFDRNKVTPTADVDPESVTRNVTATTSGNPEKIYGIRWALGTRDGFSGTDKATSADDTINAGIYWIDNIVVAVDAPVISDETLVAEENFDGYTGNVVHNSGARSWEKYITFSCPTGDTTSIETDPVTNSKALKIVRGGSTNQTKINFNLGEVEDKVVKISYDVRFQNHSRYPLYFPNILDKSDATTKYGLMYQSQMFWDALGSSKGGTVVATNIRDAAKKDEYVSYEYILDLEGGIVYSDIKSSTVAMRSPITSALKSNSVKTIQIGFINNANNGTDNDGTTENNGVYWIDNIRMEVVKLNLESMSIKDGETNVSTAKNLTLNFNQPVAENTADAIFVVKNNDEMLEIGTDYNVTLSDDAKTVTISPVSGNWDYESTYTVSIGKINGNTNIIPYPGTNISFVTGAYSNILLSDNFENLTVGQKWTGAGTFTIGNITLNLSEGDTVEYAYDEEEQEYGLKLIKSNTDGDLDFIYSFPGGFTDGKYMVNVDSRIENHSKGHLRWPALLSGATSGEIQRMGLRATSFWLQQTGTFGVDRYGVDHSSVSNSRRIGPAQGNARTTVFGELSTGAGIKFGLNTPSTNSYYESVEPATTATTLGGVLMRMKSGEMEITETYRQAYECGTQVDEDTVNNPDNFGIAWIYGITVEKVTLAVKETSFEDNIKAFNPSQPLTVTFNQKLDINTATTDNIELYEAGNQISSYDYTINIAEDGKTVTINPVSGLKFGTEYKIVVKKTVKAADSQVVDMHSDKTYIITTENYEDTKAPDIIWSTLPDGIKNVDPSIGSVILNTNDVFLADDTINTDNIKVYENNSLFTDYTVEKEGLFAIKVNLGTLKKDTEYEIVVSGLLSGGNEALSMTEDFKTTFKTRGDVYADSIVSGITADGEKSYISAELFNKSGADINYQVIGVLKDAEGKIISVAKGSNGTLANDGVTDIIVENVADTDAVSYDLYIWDGISSMKPLVKKEVLNPVNTRTYGYDNYIDSSKPLKVSYIGGSITQQRQYTTPLSTMLSTFLKKDNEERTITYSVQGIGGTNSTLGLYRLEKDVVAYNPDVVFVEFAVNDCDTDSANRVKSMEGIIRKLMKLEHQPMVVLLDLTTAGYASMNVIEDWKPLMDAYGIGYVNVAQYIKENEATAENPDGLYVWHEKDLATYPNATALTATDGVHPTAAGGQIYADYIYKILSENPESFFKKMTVVETPVSGYEYRKATMDSWENAIYDGNWIKTNDLSWNFYKGVLKPKTAGATVTYKFTGTTIGLFVVRCKTGTSATYSIDDGAYTGTVNCYENASTDVPRLMRLRTDLDDGEHTITITVNEAEDVNFRFGYFVVD